MGTDSYDDLLIRVENDLISLGMTPVILDIMPLKENSGLDGVAYLKGDKAYIFIDKTLSTFDKAKTLVEEYHHAISDIGNHMDYDATLAHNDEIVARESVIKYMTPEKVMMRIAHEYEDQPFEAWMLCEYLGYPLDFAQETVNLYRRNGLLN